MQPAITVRPAIPADISNMAILRGGGEKLVQTMLAYLHGDYSPSYALACRRVLIATIDDQFAGYISGQLTTRFGCDGELQWLNVAEPFQRQGVADTLIKELLTWFKAEGAKTICVNVAPENLIARKVYAKHGAVQLNEHWLIWREVL